MDKDVAQIVATFRRAGLAEAEREMRWIVSHRQYGVRDLLVLAQRLEKELRK